MTNPILSEGYRNHIAGCIGEYIKENGRLPKKKDMENKMSVKVVVNTYGGWKNALESLGFIKDSLSPEKSVSKLKKIVEELGFIPTIKELKELDIDIKPAIELYGSWTEVKKYLKGEFTTLKPVIRKQNKLSKEKLKEEKLKLGEQIIALTRKLKNVPKINDLKDEEISIYKVNKLFENWNKAKEELSLRMIAIEEIVKDIKEIQKENVKRPSLSELKDYGVNTTLLIKEFGTWKEACNELNIALYDEEGIKTSLTDLAKSLGRTPLLKDIKDKNIPINYLIKEHSSWKNVVSDMELYKYDLDKTINEIKELSEIIDNTPRIVDMKENGVTKLSKVLKYYGGWNNLRAEIGLPKHSKYSYTEIKSIENDILSLADYLGNTPTLKEVLDRKIKYTALLSKYGSWNEILNGLGLELNNKYSDKEIDNLINKIKNLALELGRTPTISEMKDNNIAISPLKRKYGSVSKCLIENGIKPNVLSSKNLDKDEIIKEIQALATKIGKKPSMKMVKENGIKVYALLKEYGSWKNIKKIISVNDEECMLTDNNINEELLEVV